MRRFSDLAPHLKLRFFQAQAYKRTFGQPEDHEVLGDLYRFCGLNRELMVAGDALATAHNLGMRRVGLRIASFMGLGEAEVQGWLAEHDPKGANRYEGKA